MKEVQAWTAVICFAALAAALIRWILPAGPMERMGRFVAGAVMICAMIAPAAGFFPGLRTNFARLAGETSSRQSNGVSSAVEGAESSEAKKSIVRLVRTETARLGINCKNVSVDMDRGKDGRIVISRIKVMLGKKDASRAEELRKYLEKELGLDTEVAADDG